MNRITWSVIALVAAVAPLLELPLAAQITGRMRPLPIVSDTSRKTLSRIQPGPPPTGLAVTGTPAKAFVSWQPAPNAVSYSVDRWLKALPNCCRNAVSGLTTTTWTDENGMLQWSGIYVFALSVTYADGSVGSAQLEWTRPEPSNPGTFTATQAGAGTVRLDWSAVPDATYYLLWGPGLADGTKATGTSHTVSNVPNGIHRYTVAAYFEPGPVSTESSMWPQASVTVAPVQQPTFALAKPSPIVVRRGLGSIAVTANITRVAGFSGPVSLSFTGLPQGVVAGPATIPAGQTSAQIALTATLAADYGNRTITLVADGGTVRQSANYTLLVFRETGAFAKASFAVTTPPQSAVSASGAVRVNAHLGSALGLPSAFGAVFDPVGGVGPIGQPIPFNHGQTNVQGQAFGGAGFCAGPIGAFVISGSGPGVSIPSSAQYLVSVFELTNPSVVGTADVAAFRSANPPYYFEPAVYFSKDCSLALAVGAHPLGPENNLAQVIDLKTGRVINSIEFSAPLFSASVVDAGTRQQIAFMSGGVTQNFNLP